ncbi:MAG: hypothetical protein LUB59_04050 [Candidatus Gastranaerophilales bacterium]|nr:hypothetical protein [Candidatus Gastranaerophilales bacterium]
MSNLNEGVGKKIVEALKKQTELESSGIIDNFSTPKTDNLGVDVSAIDEITNKGLLQSSLEDATDMNGVNDISELFNDYEETTETKESFNDFLNRGDRTPEAAAMPGNIIILRKLISQLPSGVTRHTGAQIIKQTMEALGISMKSVLTEAQEVQNNLKESSKECQMMIQEYKRKITNLEKQSQNYQKQYVALNDLISLFIQTTQ